MVIYLRGVDPTCGQTFWIGSAELSFVLLLQAAGAAAVVSPYLPQFPAEDNLDYELRRKNAPFTNIYSDISKNLSSKPFSKTCELDESAADDLKQLATNVDGQGNNLHVFAATTFKAGIDYGIDWIWVDYTKIDSPSTITLADERNMGARPYWVRIPALQMFAPLIDFILDKRPSFTRVYSPFSGARSECGEKRSSQCAFDTRPCARSKTNKVVAYAHRVRRREACATKNRRRIPSSGKSGKDREGRDQPLGVIPSLFR
jgi:hypothetical protein